MILSKRDSAAIAVAGPGETRPPDPAPTFFTVFRFHLTGLRPSDKVIIGDFVNPVLLSSTKALEPDPPDQGTPSFRSAAARTTNDASDPARHRGR